MTGSIGSFATITTGCDGVVLAVSGVPTLGGKLSYDLRGGAGTSYLWFGDATGPFVVCPPSACALGAELGIVLVGVQKANFNVPCELALVGGCRGCQGAYIAPVPVSTCPAGAVFQLSFSDTVITTIN